MQPVRPARATADGPVDGPDVDVSDSRPPRPLPPTGRPLSADSTPAVSIRAAGACGRRRAGSSSPSCSSTSPRWACPSASPGRSPSGLPTGGRSRSWRSGSSSTSRPPAGSRRRREVVADGQPYIELKSVWSFAGLLLLPIGLALALVVVTFAYWWLRVSPAPGAAPLDVLRRDRAHRLRRGVAGPRARARRRPGQGRRPARPARPRRAPALTRWVVNHGLVVFMICLSAPGTPWWKRLGVPHRHAHRHRGARPRRRAGRRRRDDAVAAAGAAHPRHGDAPRLPDPAVRARRRAPTRRRASPTPRPGATRPTASSPVSAAGAASSA